MIRKVVVLMFLLLAAAILLMGVYSWPKPVIRRWQYWRANLPGLVGWQWQVSRVELEITHSVITGIPVPDSYLRFPPVRTSHNGFIFRWEHEDSHVMEWSFPAKTYPQSIDVLQVPLWPPLVLVLIYPLIVFHRLLRRRHRHSHKECLHCGYNLTGNTSGVCPECGRAVNSPADAHAR